MIFVTVGTHEQQFNRLVKCVDELKATGTIQDEVIIQTGFSTYKPQYCTSSELFSYQQMLQNVKDARIVITHGGPSSFIMPLQMGKIPIVVPRQKQFGEHVNDHQLIFTRAVAERQGNIIVVEEESTLKEIVLNYENIIGMLPIKVILNNAEFNNKLRNIVDNLIRW